MEWLELSCSFFSLKTGIHFTGLMLFQQMKKKEDKCVTSLESNCLGFTFMVLRALRLNLHVDAEMMNVGIKQAWCHQMYHPDGSCHKNIQYQ
jgi:hypothetical protein